MPSMNILADFRFVTELIHNIDHSIHHYKNSILEITMLYHNDSPDVFIHHLDNLLSRYNTKDLFFIASFDGVQITKLLEQAINRLDKQDKLFYMATISLIKGYREDKEIINYWSKKSIHVDLYSLGYNIKKMFLQYNVSSRSALIKKLMQHNLYKLLAYEALAEK